MAAVTTPAELRERRGRVEDRYLAGMPLARIARELELAERTVSSDLKWIAVGWMRERADEGTGRLELELRKIDRLEREAWQAWLRSQEDLDATKVSRDGAKEKAERTVRRQIGDPRYLAVVKDCIDRRCRLLGMLATAQKKSASERPLPAVEVVVRDADELARLWSVDDLLERLGREAPTEGESANDAADEVAKEADDPTPDDSTEEAA